MPRINHNVGHANSNNNQQQTNLLTKVEKNTDNINVNITSTNTHLDTFSGHGNNNVGMGSTKLQVYPYAHNATADHMQPLKVNANGALECSVNELEVTLTDVNLNVDTLETLITATNTHLDTFSGHGNNIVGEGATKLQTYLYGRDVSGGVMRPLVCDGDAHLQIDCLSSALPTGGATEAKQDVQETTLDAILAKNTELETLLSTIDADTNDIKLNTQSLEDCVAGTEMQVDIVSSALPSGAATQSTLSSCLGELQSLLSDTNIIAEATTEINTGAVVLAAGSASIGKLAANSGVDIGDVDVASLPLSFNSGNKDATCQRIVIATDDVNLSAIKTSIQLIDNAMHTGLIPSAALNVSVGTSALPSGAATDNSILSMRVREDVATVNGQYLMGVSAVVRQDTLASLVGTSGDNTQMSVDANGALYNISPTANSLLTTIDEDTNDIKTSVQLLDDVVGTDGAAGPTKCLSMAGTESGGAIQELLVDSAGHLQIDVISAPSTVVTNSVLTSFNDAINSSRVDVNIANGGFGGAVTNAGLTAIDAAIGTDGATGPAKCISIAGTESGGAIQELLVDSAGHLQIDVISAPSTVVTNSVLTSFNDAINSSRVDVNIANGGFGGAVTNAGLTAIDAAIGTDGATGPAKCISIAGTESGGAIQELLVDSAGHLQIDVISAPSTVVTNSVLTSFNDAINSSRVDVNIANGGFGGAVTNAGLTAIDAAIGTDGATGPAKCISIAGTESGGAIQELLVDSAGHLQIDILSGPDTIAIAAIASAAAILVTKSTLASTSELKTLLSGVTVNAGALSSEFDTENYDKIRVFGNSTALIGLANIIVMGSNTSGGTFFNLGEFLTGSTTASTHYVFGTFENLPRYIKILNNHGSTNFTFTKLYLQGSGGRLAV